MIIWHIHGERSDNMGIPMNTEVVRVLYVCVHVCVHV